jgi:hypothetical protein
VEVLEDKIIRAAGRAAVALFTSKEDRNLHVLTRFCQLNPEDEKELTAFVEREKERSGNVVEDDLPWTPAVMNAYPEFMITLHLHTQNILNALADRRKVHENDLKDFLLGRAYLRAFKEAIRFCAPIDAKGFIAPEAVKEARLELRWPFQLTDRIAQALQDVCETPDRVRKCEECGNPYVMRRVHRKTRLNRFCSVRCATRYHKRES